VWLAEYPRDWFGYTVMAGKFELKMLARAQREAVLRAISSLGAELVDAKVRNEPFGLAEPRQYLRLRPWTTGR
jgi:hypothetical protein